LSTGTDDHTTEEFDDPHIRSGFMGLRKVDKSYLFLAMISIQSVSPDCGLLYYELHCVSKKRAKFETV